MLLMGGYLVPAVKICIVLNSEQCMLCAVVLTLFHCSFLKFSFARFC
jgi:hypothetical protein